MPEHPRGDGMDRTTANQDMFPRRLFLLYVLFYAGQAIYNTYLNLYLSSVVAFHKKWKKFAFEMTKSADKYLQIIKTKTAFKQPKKTA